MIYKLMMIMMMMIRINDDDELLNLVKKDYYNNTDKFLNYDNNIYILTYYCIVHVYIKVREQIFNKYLSFLLLYLP